jgi:hypothetical protein
MRRYNHCSPVSARVNPRMIVQLLHRTGQRGCYIKVRSFCDRKGHHLV